jgi:hypothetical protein
VTGLAASPFGLLIGLVLGALGGGGSVLAVPVLVYVVGQSPQAATGTSLVIVALVSAGGLVGHWRAGHVRLIAGAAFGAAGIGGSVVGSRLNAMLPADGLLLAFALLMLVAAVGMLRRGDRSGAPADATSTAAGRRSTPDARGSGVTAARAGMSTRAGMSARGGMSARAGVSARTRVSVAKVARVVAAGTAVGFLTGLFGVGGGFVIVPALVLVLRFSITDAVGTSLLVIAVNALTALAARLVGGGVVEWSVAVPFTVAGLIGVGLGTALSGRIPAARLSRAFAVLLVVVAIAMGVDAII